MKCLLCSLYVVLDFCVPGVSVVLSFCFYAMLVWCHINQSINRFPGKNYKSEYRKTDISIEIVKKETYAYLIGSNSVLPSAFPAVSYSTSGLCAILMQSVHTVESAHT